MNFFRKLVRLVGMLLMLNIGMAWTPAAIAETFMSDGHWRDVLAFTWDVVTHSGRKAIEAALAPVLARTAAKDVQVPGMRTPPRRVKRAGIEPE